MIRRRVRILSVRAAIGLVLLAALATPAFAYLYFGHYLTVLGILHEAASLRPDDAPLSRDQQLEAFCVELPDLADDFDAVTLRLHQLFSLNWAMRDPGQCRDEGVRHMVAAHFYLHALTGSRPKPVRDAAGDVIAALTRELAARGLDSGRRAQLLCERGFATHLLGDSFAHVRLRNSRVPQIEPGQNGRMLYEAGIGHFLDGKYPDYAFLRARDDPDGWENWVTAANAALASGGRLTNFNLKVRPERADGMADALAEFFGFDDFGEAVVTGKAGAIFLNASQPPLWQPFRRKDGGACSAQVAGVAALFDGSAYPPGRTADWARTFCNDVWHDYLRRAVQAFETRGLSPFGGSAGGSPESTMPLDASCQVSNPDEHAIR